MLCCFATSESAFKAGMSNSGLPITSQKIAFVLGLIFGPFGLLLVLVASRNEEAIGERSIRKGLKKRCLICSEIVQVAAVKCRFCGEDFPIGFENDKDKWQSFSFNFYSDDLFVKIIFPQGGFVPGFPSPNYPIWNLKPPNIQ